MLGSEEEEHGSIIGEKRLEGMEESESASEEVRAVSGRRHTGCDGGAGRPSCCGAVSLTHTICASSLDSGLCGNGASRNSVDAISDGGW
ncbi:hypothetical protein AHAS_Ahas17G0098000 [Arachis hypogaea]